MAINNKYFLISAKHKPEVACAFAPEGTKLAHELIAEVEGFEELPFEFSLVKLSTGKNGLIKSKGFANMMEIWLDYQPNSLAWPLFSSKFKSLIQENLTGQECINWIKAKINFKEEQKIYYIPRFSEKLDVLDHGKTMFVPGTEQIIRPCFSLIKVQRFNVFHKPSSFWQITPEMYISEKLKKVLQKEKVTGVEFERTLIGPS